MQPEEDYLKYYDNETYLLNEVGPRFRESGAIEAVDFYLILIWKANRAKNYHLKRLKERTDDGSFQTAVSNIASSLYQPVMEREKLRILMEVWGFALPTASAILTILFPDEFTVYDWRVCKEIEADYRAQAHYSEELWAKYESFREEVQRNTPGTLSLRNKDRFLIARSIRKQAQQDCCK